MTERTQKTIDILLDALNNHVLISNSCYACAVGNLLAASLGVNHNDLKTLYRGGYASSYSDKILAGWVHLFSTDGFGESGGDYYRYPLEKLRNTKEYGNIIKELERTGYTIEELTKIEHTFETAGCGSSNSMHDKIHRLNAVIKLLLELDGDTETDVDEVFTSKAKAVVQCPA